MRKTKYMRIVAALLIGAVAIGGLTACDLEFGISSSTVRSEEIRSVVFETEGMPIIDADSANGSVSVRGVEGQTDVRITATLRSGGKNLEEAQDRVSRIKLQMSQSADRITLVYRTSDQDPDVRRHSGVSFDVTLPTSAEADVNTSNGSIELDNMSGVFRAETSNGRIAAEDLSGSLDADTSNGGITVYRATGEFRLDTSNGEIRLEDVEGTLEAETSNGQILFHGRPVGDRLKLRTSNGRIDVAIPSDSSVTVDARTSNASISSNLPLLGDTEGHEWFATLNAPAETLMILRTSNGSIRIKDLP